MKMLTFKNFNCIYYFLALTSLFLVASASRQYDEVLQRIFSLDKNHQHWQTGKLSLT